MRALHELLLYNFVDYIADLQKELPNFNELYFDEKGHSLIEQAVQADCAEFDDLVEDCKKVFRIETS